MTLLEENRCKVLCHQIELVQQAFTAYLEGSTSTLEKICSQIAQSMDEAGLHALTNGNERKQRTNQKNEDPMGHDFNRHDIHHHLHPHANVNNSSFLNN